jgi:hypothetical protein
LSVFGPVNSFVSLGFIVAAFFFLLTVSFPFLPLFFAANFLAFFAASNASRAFLRLIYFLQW